MRRHPQIRRGNTQLAVVCALLLLALPARAGDTGYLAPYLYMLIPGVVLQSIFGLVVVPMLIMGKFRGKYVYRRSMACIGVATAVTIWTFVMFLSSGFNGFWEIVGYITVLNLFNVIAPTIQRRRS